MAKKTKKAKPKRTKAKRAVVGAAMLDQLQSEISAATFEQHTKIESLEFQLHELQGRVKRLEDGHSGDPHAALGQPPSAPAEGADEPANEQV
jgi:hypothetical protein